jgi:acyl dehydratase
MVFYGAATWDFNRFHYDQDFAREHGFPQPVVDGQMLGAYLAQLLVDWVGDPGALRRLAFRFLEFAFPGDVLTCRGRVKHVRTDGPGGVVDCDVWIENQAGRLVLGPGSGTLSLR